MSLKGKTLFITGASRGIGLAIALKAAADGANIVVAAKTVEPHPKLEGTIHTAAAEIAKAGGRALPVAVDVCDEASVQAAFDKAADKFGGIDIVVNNASAIQLTPVTATDMRRYDLMQQINARGTFVVSKFAIPYLTRRENPHILMANIPRVSPQEAKKLIDEGYTYLDVRTEVEYAAGHAVGAHNVPVMILTAGYGTLFLAQRVNR